MGAAATKTGAWQAVAPPPRSVRNACKSGGLSVPRAGMGFQELRRNAGGLDKERTMRTSWPRLDPATWWSEPVVIR